MVPITLVRHPFNFYVMQALGFLIISGIGAGIGLGSAEGINSLDVKRSDYLFLAIGLVFVFLAFHMVIKYFKNAPLIKADESTITFRKGDVYSLKDVEHIHFTGKVPFPILLLNFPFEGTCILFNNGTKKYRIDNINEIVFETYPKSPICLRIRTHDFRTKVYSASTLREKHWLALMARLKEKGVSVRNECIPVN